jgi:hypothetical protein
MQEVQSQQTQILASENQGYEKMQDRFLLVILEG